MKFFLDSCNIEEIKACNEFGILDGITTNPSLVAKTLKTKNEIKDTYKKICELCDKRPVSLEVVSTEYNDIIKEAEELTEISENVCIKIAISQDGIKACKTLIDRGIMTNMTLCFTPAQALLCAKVGATFVSPFVGRLEDNGVKGIELIQKIRTIYDNYAFDTQILSASIRNTSHIEQVAEIGADVATMSYKVMTKLFEHHLTNEGIRQFFADFSKLN